MTKHKSLKKAEASPTAPVKLTSVAVMDVPDSQKWYCTPCRGYHLATVPSIAIGDGKLMCANDQRKKPDKSEWWCDGHQAWHGVQVTKIPMEGMFTCYAGIPLLEADFPDLNAEYINAIAGAALDEFDNVCDVCDQQSKSLTKYTSYDKGVAKSEWVCEKCETEDDKKAKKTQGTLYKQCFHKPTHVITKSYLGIDVYAGTKWDCGASLHQFSIFANLTGVPTPKEKPHSLIGSLKKYEHYGEREFNEIVLDWPDMGAVALPYAFWVDLVEETKVQGGTLLLACVGGHGRTGTAIAALLIVGGETAADAIAWVRKNYCDRAIESKSQEDYLALLEVQKNAIA